MNKTMTIFLAFVMLFTGTVSANIDQNIGGNSENASQEVSTNSNLEAGTEYVVESNLPKRRGGRGGSSKKKVWFYVLSGVFVVILVLYIAAGGTPQVTYG